MHKEFFVDKLRVVITDTRDEMGAAAASDAAEYMRAQIAKLGGISAIFAAAPSQNEVLEHVSREDIDWSKVTAYHMDEYVGLAPDAPQRFARYLDEHIFSKVNFGKVNYLAGDDGKLNPVYSDMFTHNRADIFRKIPFGTLGVEIILIGESAEILLRKEMLKKFGGLAGAVRCAENNLHGDFPCGISCHMIRSSQNATPAT